LGGGVFGAEDVVELPHELRKSFVSVSGSMRVKTYTHMPESVCVCLGVGVCVRHLPRQFPLPN